ALSLINHVTFWGGLNDLAGGDQLEMVGAGELNCFWKWPRSGQPIYTTASAFWPSSLLS
ncbi:Integration host factor subunit beta, partial [Clarias magur]